MVQLYDGGAYVLNGTEIIPDTADAAKILAGKMGAVPSREEAKKTDHRIWDSEIPQYI